jgi:hypothetical protein
MSRLINVRVLVALAPGAEAAKVAGSRRGAGEPGAGVAERSSHPKTICKESSPVA